MSQFRIRKAILPVAGFGTRFLPATKAMPKEMLPIVDKPAIQYLVEEAVASGIEEIIFITGRGKRSIEDHFDYSFELEYTLVEKNKTDLLKEVRRISEMASFAYVRQPLPLGDGHAILCARHLIGNEPVAIMFGDDLADAQVPALKQLIDVYEKYQVPVIALAQVPREDVHQFGVVGSTKLDERTHEINQFVEKPKTEEAPSNAAVVGKYIITPEVLDYIEASKNDKGEIRLANAFVHMLEDKKRLIGYEYEGVRHDCGDKFSFVRATIELGLKHPEIGHKLDAYLKQKFGQH
ncbi:MAG: UTP--glucose-1-phosphate uridylyltransferase GalU [Candidatus Falkowbacteria bacterium]